MNYKEKTKEQLINESAELHQRIEDLKAIETKHDRAEFVRTYLKRLPHCPQRRLRHSRGDGNPGFKRFRMDPRLREGDEFFRKFIFEIGSSNAFFSDRGRCIFMRDSNNG